MRTRALAWILGVSFSLYPALGVARPDLAPLPLPYRAVDATWTVDGARRIGRLDVLVQEGPGDLDRFMIHRLVRLDARGQPLPVTRLRGAMILAPPQGMGFDAYFVGPGALAPYLAEQGFDVFGYTPRAVLLAEGTCAARDCSRMAAWGLGTYAADLDAIRAVATALHRKRPAIGGMSLGAMLTLAAVDRRPSGYAGALVWEGTLAFSDAGTEAAFAPVCQSYADAVQAGAVYDDQTFASFKTVWALMASDPDGASPFVDGLTNREYGLLALTTPADPPLGEAPGYTYVTGDVAGGLVFTDEAAVGALVGAWATYDPVALLRDVACARAGDRRWVDGLGLFRGPVLAIEAGHGFGASMEASLAMFAHAGGIQRLAFPERSHLDVLLARDEQATVSAPIHDWLVREVAPRM